jgi:membrane-bound lytic murein transglycosylase D
VHVQTDTKPNALHVAPQADTIGPSNVYRLSLVAIAMASVFASHVYAQVSPADTAPLAPSTPGLNPVAAANAAEALASTVATTTPTTASTAGTSAITTTLSAPLSAPTTVTAPNHGSEPAGTSIANTVSSVNNEPIAPGSQPLTSSGVTAPGSVAAKQSESPASTAPIVQESALLPATSYTQPFAPVEAPPTDIWDRIRAGYAMEDLDDELVGKWEKYYADRPDYVARIVERSSKYMFYIVTELERRNMPLEIALLPMIESAFNPIAHSTAKASGIWQFIPSTGSAFGMKQDWWADSRRDIVAATNGALDYLTKLHGMFGDWQLALASYNWGEGAVMRASNRAKNSGKDGTYLTLNMPAETRNYLPKLQAVKNIIRNPSAFGLTIASVPNEPYFKTITLAHALDLKKAAQLAGMTESEFVALNPAHNRPVIAGRGDFQILLPADKAEQFISRLEADENPRVSWMAYKTKPGDRVDSVAQRFGTTVSALKSVNGIRGASNTLPVGYNLLVPSDGPSSDALGSIQNAVFTKFPEQASAARSHRVRKGESLGMIAKRYGIATSTLAKWNRLGKPVVRVGQTIYVSGPAPIRATAKNVRAAHRSGGKVVKASSGGKVKKAVKRSAKPQRL